MVKMQHRRRNGQEGHDTQPAADAGVDATALSLETANQRVDRVQRVLGAVFVRQIIQRTIRPCQRHGAKAARSPGVALTSKLGGQMVQRGAQTVVGGCRMDDNHFLNRAASCQQAIQGKGHDLRLAAQRCQQDCSLVFQISTRSGHSIPPRTCVSISNGSRSRGGPCVGASCSYSGGTP